jgi:sulfur carrier protein
MAPGDAAPRSGPPIIDVADGLAVQVNGERRRIAAGATVADLVAEWCPSPDGIAVALNREVVPRSAWPSTGLAHDDHVEIVSAAAGG